MTILYHILYSNNLLYIIFVNYLVIIVINNPQLQHLLYTLSHVC